MDMDKDKLTKRAERTLTKLNKLINDPVFDRYLKTPEGVANANL